VVPRHQLRSCVARSRVPGWNRPTGPARRGQPRVAQSPLVLLLRPAGDVVALAPPAGRRRVGLPASPDRPTTTGPPYPAADRPSRRGEPLVGLPAHQGRTPPAWRAGLGHRDPNNAPPPPPRPGAAAGDQELAGVPAPAGRWHRGLRLLHCRHGVATKAVGAVVHRTRHQTGPPRRSHGPPERHVGHSASPQPAADPGRAGTTAALCPARPRREVLPQLRRRVPLTGKCW
jgi:hypothetical protein